MNRRLLGVMLAASTSGIVAACEKQAATIPTAATSATVQSVTISGLPAELAVGERVQLAARAAWSDGRSEDVTGRARWTSGSLSCLITPAAVVSANQAGTCSITAALDAVSANAATNITPARAFTISGVVREKYQLREPPLPGSTVTIISGVRTGTTIVTDALGRYRFDGIPRERVSIRAQAPGFDPQTVELSPDAPEADVFLPPEMAVITYDSRVRGQVDEFLVTPFRITHRGPTTIVHTLERNECGTYETFWSWVRPAGSLQGVMGAASCSPGVSTNVQVLEPGDYEFVVRRFWAWWPRLTVAELTHPR